MKDEQPHHEKSFSDKVGEKEKRKISAQGEKRSVWSGLGLFGIVGWSIVVPTLLGAALGIWLDKKYGQSFSWTLSLLLVGLVLGVVIAWNWVNKENKEINKKQEDENE